MFLFNQICRIESEDELLHDNISNLTDTELCRSQKQHIWKPGYCNSYWDTVVCWPPTPPNSEAREDCSLVSFRFKTPRFVFRGNVIRKQCMSDGEWYSNSVNNSIADYSECTKAITESEWLFSLPVRVQLVGNCISICALLLALILFMMLKHLRCPRIKMHQNLFLSFILSSVTQEMWQMTLINGDYLVANPLWCRVLHVVQLYAMISNYTWMFCEGLYLQIMLWFTNVKENRFFVYLLILGWGSPAIPMTVYALARSYCTKHAEQHSYCWSRPINPFFWIYAAFPFTFLLLNLMLLLNMIRIILQKTNVSSAQRGRNTMFCRLANIRATLKAMVILFPLLGAQHIVQAYSELAFGGLILNIMWLILKSLIISLQGLAVATVVCFASSEVYEALRHKYRQRRMVRLANRSRSRRRKNGAGGGHLGVGGVLEPGTTTLSNLETLPIERNGKPLVEESEMDEDLMDSGDSTPTPPQRNRRRPMTMTPANTSELMVTIMHAISTDL